MAVDAAKQLVSPPRLVIYDVVFDEAKLAGVVAVAIPHTFLYGFVEEDLGDGEVASVRSRDFQTVLHLVFLLM